MMNPQYNLDVTNELFRKAEKLIKPVSLSAEKLSHADVCKLANELRVHQIERKHFLLHDSKA